MPEVETWECGLCARAMSASGYCWPCGPTARLIVTVPNRAPTDPGYWLHRPKKVTVEWPEHDPAPVVTNFQPRPEGAPEDPTAVKKLQRAAEGAGWPIRVGYSRGLLRTRSVGVYKDVEIIGVWADWAHDWRFCAMYERTIGAATGWKWSEVAAWQRGKPMRSKMTITELYALLSVEGAPAS